MVSLDQRGQLEQPAVLVRGLPQWLCLLARVFDCSQRKLIKI